MVASDSGVSLDTVSSMIFGDSDSFFTPSSRSSSQLRTSPPSPSPSMSTTLLSSGTSLRLSSAFFACAMFSATRKRAPESARM